VSHTSKLLLCCLAWAFACNVPTLEELEAERPAGCNEEHSCAEGSVCFENRCIRTAGLECVPGTRTACGSDVGQCRAGTRLCGEEGRFGDCLDEVVPRIEVCDGEDNDCDGQVDSWPSVALSKANDLGSFLAAVPVSRASLGKPDTVLVVTTEAGSLVTRALTAGGTPSQGDTVAPEAQNIRYQLPTLAAHGDTVAVAWLEEKLLSTTGQRQLTVKLALLDGSGTRTSPVINLPRGSLQPLVTGLKVAINSTHVLVLVSTSDTFSSTGGMPARELWAVTVSRALGTSSPSFPLKLAAPGEDFGPYATANGTAETFLVAYADGSAKKVGTLLNEGRFASTPIIITQSAHNHSPFLAPIRDNRSGYTLFFVQNSLQLLNKAEILSVECTTTGCNPPTVFGSFAHKIERMRMARRPGEARPDLALWRWKDDGTQRSAFTIASLTPSMVERVAPLNVSSVETFAEELVLMRDFSRYVLFHQNPVSSGLVSASEAYLLPFCGP
jgi:hypothetical protein